MSGSGAPLAAFEEFLYWQDQPAYPCNCFMRLGFTGRIDREALMSAVRAVVPRHPLLTSAIERRGLSVRWTERTGVLPDVEWVAASPGGPFPAAPHLDPGRDVGLRLTVVEGRDACDLVVQCHHSCSDGMGMEMFVNDLLIAYAAACNPPADSIGLPLLDESRLARRRYCGLTLGTFLRALPGQAHGLPGVVRFLCRSPAPLVSRPAPPAGDPPTPDYPSVRLHAFTGEETAALRGVARRLGTTTNDLLVRDIYLALGEWHAPAEQAWCRMMVPMNLRSAEDQRMPAANCVSAVFLDRRRADLADRSQLLAGIARELGRIKAKKLGYIFIYSLWLIGLVPGAIRRKVRQDRCYSTCVFTNMGKILGRSSLPRRDGKCVVGGLVLEEVAFVAPLRPHTGVTFGATEYAGRLRMTIHYDSRAITPDRADELTEALARSVRRTISAGT